METNSATSNSNSTQLKVITRNTKDTIGLAKKWKIIEDYLACKLSTVDIAEKHQVSESTVGKIVQETYKKFQNVKETKTLIATQSRPDVFLQLKKDCIDPERINKGFLELLSEQDSEVLTDNEAIFCELFVNNGDDFIALEESGLHIGLNRKDSSYRDSLRLRSFYLRRKHNIALRIRDIQKNKLKLMDYGKEHLQGELLALVEKLRNNSDPRSIPSILRAIELLGKSIGAFEEKITIDNINGDDSLDRILNKAKRANRELIEI